MHGSSVSRWGIDPDNQGSSMTKAPKYGKVLLKLSGEALAGDRGFGIEPSVVDQITNEIIGVHEMGVSLGVVIGGG